MFDFSNFLMNCVLVISVVALLLLGALSVYLLVGMIYSAATFDHDQYFSESEVMFIEECSKTSSVYECKHRAVGLRKIR